MSGINCESLHNYSRFLHPDTTIGDLELKEFWTVFTHLGGIVHVLHETSYLEYERKYLEREKISKTMKLSELKEKVCNEASTNGGKKI